MGTGARQSGHTGQGHGSGFGRSSARRQSALHRSAGDIHTEGEGEVDGDISFAGHMFSGGNSTPPRSSRSGHIDTTALELEMTPSQSLRMDYTAMSLSPADSSEQQQQQQQQQQQVPSVPPNNLQSMQQQHQSISPQDSPPQLHNKYLPQQSRSLHSSPQIQKHFHYQRQHNFQVQQAAAQGRQNQHQQQSQAPSHTRGNISFPSPPQRNYHSTHNSPHQQQAPMQKAALNGYGNAYPASAYGPAMTAGQVASSMHGSPGMGPAHYGSVGSSYNSYGYVGSMQDSNGVNLTDFALALMRPDMDEQRRLLSQQQPMLWQQQQQYQPHYQQLLPQQQHLHHQHHQYQHPSYAQSCVAGSPGSGIGYLQGHSMVDPYSSQQMHSSVPGPPQMAMSYGFMQGHMQQGHPYSTNSSNQQQAGSFDSKTMYTRRKQHEQHSRTRQDRHSVNNLADLANVPFSQPESEPIGDDHRGNTKNNVKRLSGSGRNVYNKGKDAAHGGNRSEISLLQATFQPAHHPDLRKPSPTYVNPRTPPVPGTVAVVGTAPLPPAGPVQQSSIIKISVDNGVKPPTPGIAGSYVDTEHQHSFHPLRAKNGSTAQGAGSFIVSEMERRESFVASVHQSAALGPASPATSESNSINTSTANSRQNSMDSSSDAMQLGFSSAERAYNLSRHSSSGTPGGVLPGLQTTHGGKRPGQVRRAVSKGDGTDDVMEEWHPFFEADAI